MHSQATRSTCAAPRALCCCCCVAVLVVADGYVASLLLHQCPSYYCYYCYYCYYYYYYHSTTTTTTTTTTATAMAHVSSTSSTTTRSVRASERNRHTAPVSAHMTARQMVCVSRHQKPSLPMSAAACLGRGTLDCLLGITMSSHLGEPPPPCQCQDCNHVAVRILYLVGLHRPSQARCCKRIIVCPLPSSGASRPRPFFSLSLSCPPASPTPATPAVRMTRQSFARAKA